MLSSGDPKGYYRALGVAPGATPEAIRAAFRERAKVLHPDRAFSAVDEAGFRKLAEAYEVLRDPRRRLEYDSRALAATTAPAAPRARPAEPPPTPPSDELAELRLRGARPQRVGATRPLTAEVVAGAERWRLATVILALLLAVGGGVLWRMHGRITASESEATALAARLEASTISERELRGRVAARAVGAAADRAEERAGWVVFARDIPFQPGSADIDEPLEIVIDTAVIELSRALRQVPPDAPWVVLIEGYAGSAAAPDGVAVVAWETALLRLGAVIERLLAQGLPAERLATRFNAGFAVAEETPVVEVKLICCTR
jgi:hypothetical protein